MKKLTRDHVVPIVSASVSWRIFAITGAGVPSLPKFAKSQEQAGKPLLAGRRITRDFAHIYTGFRWSTDSLAIVLTGHRISYFIETGARREVWLDAGRV